MSPKYRDFITAIRRGADRMRQPLIAWYVRNCSGANIGSHARFDGLPIIMVRGGARLDIGDSFYANSSKISNPVGLPHPVVLGVFGEGASLSIGNCVGISGASISCRSSIRIGNNVMIGGGAGIWDNDFHSLDAEVRRVTPSGGIASRPIIIEDDVFIGARAIILKGVTIGKGAIIGAGAIVAKSVPAGAVAVGNPAQIRERKQLK